MKVNTSFAEHALERENVGPKERVIMSNLQKCTALFVLVAMCSSSLAGETGEVVIHGTGSWAVGNSDQYEYLQGGGEGSNQWQNIDFMLNLSSHPYENLRIGAQLWYEIESEETEVALEVAFAEWAFSEVHHLRAGLSRVPFGIYADIFDIGTLRPFYSLPQSVYGSNGMIPEGYAGIGLWGQLGDGWHLVYDLYVGGMKTRDMDMYMMFIDADSGAAPADGDEGGMAEMSRDRFLDDVVGGHIQISTPWDGLSFGLSSYVGKPRAEEDPGEGESEDPIWSDQEVYGVQLEYMSDALLLRTEYIMADKNNGSINAFYIELAHRFLEHWQLAGRFESIELDPDLEIDADALSLLDHEEYVIGINYWLNPGAVVKLAFHSISGNLLTHPEGGEIREVVEAGNLDNSTRLLNLGVQFSF